MNIEKMKYFMDLYECRSFTETAKRNYISQASISQYITSLEKEFDTQFFDRKVTPIRPTKAGDRFYQEARILVKQYENMQDQMKNLSEKIVPKIRLAYTSVIDLQLLLPFIMFLREKDIRLQIVLEKVACKDIDAYVSNNLCDLALSFSDEFSNSHLTYISLKKGRYNVLVSKQHPLFEKEFITVEELYQCPLLMLSEEKMGESFHTMKERSIADGFFPKIERTVDEFEASFFYIISDNLIGFVTDGYDVENFAGMIRSIPIDQSQHSYNIVLAYIDQNQNSGLKQFLETLSEYQKIQYPI